MDVILLYVLISSLITSFISLIGISFFLFFKKNDKIIFYWISFAAGVILGSVFLRMLPEITHEESISNLKLYTFVLTGIISYFLIEKFLRWVHCHKETNELHVHPVGIMNLFGDGIHNFLDGVAIGISYHINIHIGILTTLMIILHEVPQEIGDFGMLLYAGFTQRKALFWNFISALSAVIGSIGGYIFGNFMSHSTILIIMAFVGGGFLYIAMSDIVPELHKTNTTKEALIQTITILLGIGIIALFSYFAVPHLH